MLEITENHSTGFPNLNGCNESRRKHLSAFIWAAFVSHGSIQSCRRFNLPLLLSEVSSWRGITCVFKKLIRALMTFREAKQREQWRDWMLKFICILGKLWLFCCAQFPAIWWSVNVELIFWWWSWSFLVTASWIIDRMKCLRWLINDGFEALAK